MSFNNILRLFKSLSRSMAHYSHMIYACYQNKTCLPRVNMRQITLLRGNTHPNEQPVVFIPYMLCPFAAHL